MYLSPAILSSSAYGTQSRERIQIENGIPSLSSCWYSFIHCFCWNTTFSYVGVLRIEVTSQSFYLNKWIQIVWSHIILFYVLCFSFSFFIYLFYFLPELQLIPLKPWCCFRPKSFRLICRTWTGSWLTLIAEVDLGSGTTQWSTARRGFMRGNTRGMMLFQTH